MWFFCFATAGSFFFFTFVGMHALLGFAWFGGSYSIAYHSEGAALPRCIEAPTQFQVLKPNQ